MDPYANKEPLFLRVFPSETDIRLSAARTVWLLQFKSNQIKSLLLSHHHSTSALVSEILMSVLQTVQKNNRQFTYGQTVQKKQQTIYIWTDSAKKQQTIYLWTDSAKKTTTDNLHMDRQCKKLHWSIYSAPDSAKKNKKNNTTPTAIYIWTDSAKKQFCPP